MYSMQSVMLFYEFFPSIFLSNVGIVFYTKAHIVTLLYPTEGLLVYNLYSSIEDSRSKLTYYIVVEIFSPRQYMHERGLRCPSVMLVHERGLRCPSVMLVYCIQTRLKISSFSFLAR